jgi:hypothetical protein
MRLEFCLVLAVLTPLHAQTGGNAPADTNPAILAVALDSANPGAAASGAITSDTFNHAQFDGASSVDGSDSFGQILTSPLGRSPKSRSS